MPKCSSCGPPVGVTCSAASTTAPSTQPPETAPAISPVAFIALLAPGRPRADGAFGAAAGDRARDLAVGVDRHLRAGRSRRGPLDADHGRERDRVAASGPGVDLFEYVLHEMPSSISSASASSEAIEFPGSS